MTYTEFAATAASGATARPRRVLAGERMVTPVRPIRLGPDYVPLWPERDRVAIDHPLVESRPEAFRPCDRKDSYTAARLREHLERRARLVDAEIRNRGGQAERVRPRQRSTTWLSPPPLRGPNANGWLPRP